MAISAHSLLTLPSRTLHGSDAEQAMKQQKRTMARGATALMAGPCVGLASPVSTFFPLHAKMTLK